MLYNFSDNLQTLVDALVGLPDATLAANNPGGRITPSLSTSRDNHPHAQAERLGRLIQGALARTPEFAYGSHTVAAVPAIVTGALGFRPDIWIGINDTENQMLVYIRGMAALGGWMIDDGPLVTTAIAGITLTDTGFTLGVEADFNDAADEVIWWFAIGMNGPAVVLT